MKKRIISLIIGICMAATLVGCGKVSNENLVINKYEGIEVEKVETEKVTDEDVEQSIQSTLELRSTQNDITGRPAQDGDLVIIDFVGKQDGVEFENGSAKDQTLVLGSKRFIDGFESGIVGHSVGDVFDLNLTFPEDYEKDLAGKDVVFTVTLKGIKEVIVPELTEELVKELSETATTIEEYKKEVRADLEQSNKEHAESKFEENTWQALVDNCEIKKYPEGKKEELEEQIKERYTQTATMYGFKDAEEFLKEAYDLTIEEMADNIIKQEIAVKLIAEEEGIKVSKEEYKKKLEKYALENGYEKGSELEEVAGKENLEKLFLQEDVVNWLMDNCKKVEPKKETKEK